MRVLGSALALVGALVVSASLTLVLPAQGRAVDPFLIVVVYCALNYGETHGMLTGAAAGWIQDIQFGGPVSGLSGLTKLLVGFVVGAAATRFLITGSAARALVLFVATLFEDLAFERLAGVLEVTAAHVPLPDLLLRSALNALIGALAFRAAEAYLGREARA